MEVSIDEGTLELFPTIENHFSLTMFQVKCVGPLIDISRLSKVLLAVTRLLPVFPFTLILVILVTLLGLRIILRALAFLFIVDPLTNVIVAIGEEQATEALPHAVSPVTLIDFATGVNQSANSIELSAELLTQFVLSPE